MSKRKYPFPDTTPEEGVCITPREIYDKLEEQNKLLVQLAQSFSDHLKRSEDGFQRLGDLEKKHGALENRMGQVALVGGILLLLITVVGPFLLPKLFP